MTRRIASVLISLCLAGEPAAAALRASAARPGGAPSAAAKAGFPAARIPSVPSLRPGAQPLLALPFSPTPSPKAPAVRALEAPSVAAVPAAAAAEKIIPVRTPAAFPGARPSVPRTGPAKVRPAGRLESAPRARLAALPQARAALRNAGIAFDGRQGRGPGSVSADRAPAGCGARGLKRGRASGTTSPAGEPVSPRAERSARDAWNGAALLGLGIGAVGSVWYGLLPPWALYITLPAGFGGLILIWGAEGAVRLAVAATVRAGRTTVSLVRMAFRIPRAVLGLFRRPARAGKTDPPPIPAESSEETDAPAPAKAGRLRALPAAVWSALSRRAGAIGLLAGTTLAFVLVPELLGPVGLTVAGHAFFTGYAALMAGWLALKAGRAVLGAFGIRGPPLALAPWLRLALGAAAGLALVSAAVIAADRIPVAAAKYMTTAATFWFFSAFLIGEAWRALSGAARLLLRSERRPSIGQALLYASGLAVGLFLGLAPALRYGDMVERLHAVHAGVLKDDNARKTRRIGPAFSEEAAQILAANPKGSALLDSLRDRGGVLRLPAFFLAPQEHSGAYMHGLTYGVYINPSVLARRGWTEEEFLADPEKQRRLARELEVLVYHELVHAAQQRWFGMRGPLPEMFHGQLDRFPRQLESATSLEVEYEAYVGQELYVHEKLKADPRARLGWGDLYSYELFLQDLEAYLGRLEGTKTYHDVPHVNAKRYETFLQDARRRWPAWSVEGYTLLARRHWDSQPWRGWDYLQEARRRAAEHGLPEPRLQQP